MIRRFGLGIAGLLALGGLAIGATFDGNPPAPQPIHQHPDYSSLDVQVHERGSTTSLPSINAQHGADCSGPPATHPNTSFEGSVYICNNHVMTAINGASYGVIYLTPNRLIDLSGTAVVEWEMSTEKMSVRDWWDVTVSPFMDAQALPLLAASQGVDLQHPNRNSVVVTADSGEGAPSLKVVRNGTLTDYGPPGWAGTRPSSGITVGTNQAATRQPFRLTITQTRVRFERLASPTGSAVVFFDRTIPNIGFTSGVVQFGHHSYDPTKDGAGVPATWHWDTFAMSPSTPFTIEHAAPRALFASGTVTFPAAPSGAYLRFSALCRPVVNGVALTKMTDSGHPEHASSYMVPIPAGSTTASISFQADGWYGTGFGCHAKDFHVWSLSASPTASPTATATSTSTPANTATASPTATFTSTPTRTPTPGTYRCQRRNPNGSYQTVWTGPGGSCP